MQNEKLLVLIINDMVIFPNNEVRIEYDNNYDNQIIEIVDHIEDNLMLIVNPIDDKSKGLTSLPKYGVLGRLKLKINVPNGKTRMVIEGLDRVEITNYEEEGNYYKANYKDVEIEEEEDHKNYGNLLLKSLNTYINKVPYMGNAILTQIEQVNNLSDLCDLVASFLPLGYDQKKKYITILSPTKRCELLIEDMSRDLKFVEIEENIEKKVEEELNETQKEYFLREKIKEMQKELGDANSKDIEIEKLKEKLKKLKCSSKVKEIT